MAGSDFKICTCTGIQAQKDGDWDSGILRLLLLLFGRVVGSSQQVLPLRYGLSLSKYFESICFWFGVIYHSGVELYNSELISIGMVDNSEDLTLKLGFKVVGFSSSYLGLPLEASFRNCGNVDGVE